MFRPAGVGPAATPVSRRGLPCALPDPAGRAGSGAATDRPRGQRRQPDPAEVRGRHRRERRSGQSARQGRRGHDDADRPVRRASAGAGTGCGGRRCGGPAVGGEPGTDPWPAQGEVAAGAGRSGGELLRHHVAGRTARRRLRRAGARHDRLGAAGRPVDNRNRVVQGLVRGGSRQRHRPTGRADATPR